MIFEITHTTHYRFSEPVFLEPHVLRLEPRTCGAQFLERFELSLAPPPAGRCRYLDAQGNVVTRMWFDGVYTELRVRARSVVRTERTNPFDYLVDSAASSLPLEYAAPLDRLLEPARERGRRAESSDPVTNVAREVLEGCPGGTVEFLGQLCRELYERLDVVVREEGGTQEPAETLRLGSGACRDLTVLFMDACRSLGLAARFVSGYQEGVEEQDERDLHAWAEVYVPGGGWRGYDPTHGLAVSDRHVALAAAVSPPQAAPIDGSFRGTGARTTLETHLDLATRESPPPPAPADQ